MPSKIDAKKAVPAIGRKPLFKAIDELESPNPRVIFRTDRAKAIELIRMNAIAPAETSTKCAPEAEVIMAVSDQNRPNGGSPIKMHNATIRPNPTDGEF